MSPLTAEDLKVLIALVARVNLPIADTIKILPTLTRLEQAASFGSAATPAALPNE